MHIAQPRRKGEGRGELEKKRGEKEAKKRRLMEKLGVSVRLHSHEERGSLQRGTEMREDKRCQVMGRARETVV